MRAGPSAKEVGRGRGEAGPRREGARGFAEPRAREWLGKKKKVAMGRFGYWWVDRVGLPTGFGLGGFRGFGFALGFVSFSKFYFPPF